ANVQIASADVRVGGPCGPGEEESRCDEELSVHGWSPFVRQRSSRLERITDEGTALDPRHQRSVRHEGPFFRRLWASCGAACLGDCKVGAAYASAPGCPGEQPTPKRSFHPRFVPSFEERS